MRIVETLSDGTITEQGVYATAVDARPRTGGVEVVRYVFMSRNRTAY